MATQHLLEAARGSAIQRFVYASSSSIYGQAARLPTPEDVTPMPFSPYGVTKLSGEQLCKLYHGNWDVPTVSLRYFSVYGPRQRPDMAFNIFCDAALRGEPIQIFGDGRQTRDFTYVGDIVAATRAAAAAPGVAGNVYNVGGGSRVSLAHAISVLEDLLGGPIPVTYLPREPGDVIDTGADIARAQVDLGYAPATSFEEGLAAELEWSRASTSTRSIA
jgi:nucleoside-diphosphate-sugar epimerase